MKSLNSKLKEKYLYLVKLGLDNKIKKFTDDSYFDLMIELLYNITIINNILNDYNINKDSNLMKKYIDSISPAVLRDPLSIEKFKKRFLFIDPDHLKLESLIIKIKR